MELLEAAVNQVFVGFKTEAGEHVLAPRWTAIITRRCCECGQETRRATVSEERPENFASRCFCLPCNRVNSAPVIDLEVFRLPNP